MFEFIYLYFTDAETFWECTMSIVLVVLGVWGCRAVWIAFKKDEL